MHLVIDKKKWTINQNKVALFFSQLDRILLKHESIFS